MTNVTNHVPKSVFFAHSNFKWSFHNSCSIYKFKIKAQYTFGLHCHCYCIFSWWLQVADCNPRPLILLTLWVNYCYQHVPQLVLKKNRLSNWLIANTHPGSVMTELTHWSLSLDEWWCVKRWKILSLNRTYKLYTSHDTNRSWALWAGMWHPCLQFQESGNDTWSPASADTPLPSLC